MDIGGFLVYLDYIIRVMTEIFNKILVRLGIDPLGSTTTTTAPAEEEEPVVEG